MNFSDENCKGIIILRNGKIVSLNNNEKTLNDELFEFAIKYYPDLRDYYALASGERDLMAYLSIIGNIIICKEKYFFRLNDNSTSDKWYLSAPPKETDEQINELHTLKDDLIDLDITIYKYDNDRSDIEPSRVYSSIKSYYTHELDYRLIFDKFGDEKLIR